MSNGDKTSENRSNAEVPPADTEIQGDVHPAYGIAAAKISQQSQPATQPIQSSAPPQTTPPPQPAQPTVQASPAADRRGLRVGTAVWGLIVIAVGLGVLAVSVGVMFDIGVALIALLGMAGVILVVGSVVSAVRRH